MSYSAMSYTDYIVVYNVCVPAERILRDEWYPIGKAAELMGLDRSTIRRYARGSMPLLHYRLSPSGRKLFHGSELLKLKSGSIKFDMG